MRAIDRKVLRDLWLIKGQAVAIALVMASGVAMYIMTVSNFESLRASQVDHYARTRFADVFGSAQRAPDALTARMAQIPGVQTVATRVVAAATVDVAGMEEPVSGRLVSLPTRGAGRTLNAVTIVRGRELDPGQADEVLIHESFANAHELGPGATLGVVINGRRRVLVVVGIVLSPEYVYAVRPGDILPDDRRFAILWMNRPALASAFDMAGGFNDVALRLAPGASMEEVIARLDRLLEPFGGLGAVPRKQQLSHWWVDDQLRQLEGMGKVIPVLFLGVGALLLTVVMNRMVAVQRGQIAALKALGYGVVAIGRHYFLWGLVIAGIGAVIGVVVGAVLGRGMLGLQHQFYRFPSLDYQLSMATVVQALVIAMGAAAVGTASAVRRAVILPPAEAMRPEPPGHFRATLVERLGMGHLLTEPARMILRSLERRPARALASVVGIAFGGAILIVGLFSLDGMDVMLDQQFNVVQRQDVTVTFTQPVSASARHALAQLPGVVAIEPMRSVPARLRFGHRSRQVAITGIARDARLHRVIDTSLRAVALPHEGGLVLSTSLARLLGTRAGDTLTVEVLEGGRPTRSVLIHDVVDELMGTSAYMDLEALHRMMREGPRLSAAYLQIDRSRASALYQQLKALPAVAGVALRHATLESFDRTIRGMIGVTIFFNVLFAAIIAFGVVYNTARVTLSERQHELASLRVLGFTRSEISFILLGELAVLVLLAIPLGLGLGYGLAALTVAAYETDLYRIPLVVVPRVYGVSAFTVLISAGLSALLVRRRLDHLDLVEVLKTKE